MSEIPRTLVGVTLIALASILGACGGDDTPAANLPELSDLAASGREIANSQGCASCHGTDGTGGVGPTWVGLAGSEVTLDDGTTTIATEEYLLRAIADPTAEVVAGFTIQMPENALSEAEREAVVTYIQELK